MVEFGVALERDEAVVVEAFEMEVDEMLHSHAVTERRGTRSVRFGGTGSRVEYR